MHNQISDILTNLSLSQKGISDAERRYLCDDEMDGLVFFLVKKIITSRPRSLIVVTTKTSIARHFEHTVGWVDRRLELLHQAGIIVAMRKIPAERGYQRTCITISSDLVKEIFAEKPGNTIWNDYAKDLFESLKI